MFFKRAKTAIFIASVLFAIAEVGEIQWFIIKLTKKSVLFDGKVEVKIDNSTSTPESNLGETPSWVENVGIP